jgi:N-acyl-D-amino-acid deacylase
MADFDVLITNGTVIDGTGNPRYQADVGIIDGRIAKIGKLQGSSAERVLDATDLIVAPGFIDLHAHYDAQYAWDPYLTLSGRHGVTSAVIGNCGSGLSSLAPEAQDEATVAAKGVEAIPGDSMRPAMPWRWSNYAEFLDSVEGRPKALNVLPYVPVGPLLVWALGEERARACARPNEAEHRRLRRLLHEAMDAGGCGLSGQRLHPDAAGALHPDEEDEPTVADVMHDATALHVAKVLAERNEGFMQMSLSTTDPAHDFAHLEELAMVSGRPILYDVTRSSPEIPDAHRALIAWLDGCQARGVPVWGQGITTAAAFTFTLEGCNLFDEHSGWREATRGDVAARKRKLADPVRRPLLRDHVPRLTAPIPEMRVVEAFADATRPFSGLTLAEIASVTGKHPVDAMLDIAVADDLRTVFHAERAHQARAAMREIIDFPWILPGVSDGGAHTEFFTGGSYPTELLARIVRDEGMCSLEHAHFRLSALPAHCAGFSKRGVLLEGAAADIVIYDYGRLAMLPTEVARDPAGTQRRTQRARGYRWVLVNGGVTIEDDRPTNTFSGRLLRNGSQAALRRVRGATPFHDGAGIDELSPRRGVHCAPGSDPPRRRPAHPDRRGRRGARRAARRVHARERHRRRDRAARR